MNALENGDAVLPYPPRLQKEKNEFDMSQAEMGLPGTGGSVGAPVGNGNALSGSPPKSRQDSTNAESSSVSETGSRRERGQGQDEQGES
jgi:hypothetical protein